MTNKEIISDFLNNNSIISIAVNDKEDSWIFTAFYFLQNDNELVFLSGPDTEHGQMLKRNNKVSAAIYTKGSKPGYIEGAQLTGEISEARILDLPKIFKKYIKIFPIKVLEMDLKDIITSIDTKFYILKIDRIKYRNDMNTRVRIDVTY